MESNRTQRNATQRNATQRNATQRNATQRNATQRNATQRNATQRNATQRNATQRNATRSRPEQSRAERNTMRYSNNVVSLTRRRRIFPETLPPSHLPVLSPALVRRAGRAGPRFRPAVSVLCGSAEAGLCAEVDIRHE